MTPVSLLEALLWGLGGGLFLSGYDAFLDSQKPKAKRVTKDGSFWFAFVFRPILGFVLVLLYERSGSLLNSISAFGTGLTGPSILQGLVRHTQKVGLPKEGETEA